ICTERSPPPTAGTLRLSPSTKARASAGAAVGPKRFRKMTTPVAPAATMSGNPSLFRSPVVTARGEKLGATRKRAGPKSPEPSPDRDRHNETEITVTQPHQYRDRRVEAPGNKVGYGDVRSAIQVEVADHRGHRLDPGHRVVVGSKGSIASAQEHGNAPCALIGDDEVVDPIPIHVGHRDAGRSVAHRIRRGR